MVEGGGWGGRGRGTPGLNIPSSMGVWMMMISVFLRVAFPSQWDTYICQEGNASLAAVATPLTAVMANLHQLATCILSFLKLGGTDQYVRRGDSGALSFPCLATLLQLSSWLSLRTFSWSTWPPAWPSAWLLGCISTFSSGWLSSLGLEPKAAASSNVLFGVFGQQDISLHVHEVSDLQGSGEAVETGDSVKQLLGLLVLPLSQQVERRLGELPAEEEEGEGAEGQNDLVDPPDTNQVAHKGHHHDAHSEGCMDVHGGPCAHLDPRELCHIDKHHHQHYDRPVVWTEVRPNVFEDCAAMISIEDISYILGRFAEELWCLHQEDGCQVVDPTCNGLKNRCEI
ncbi:hypothetical protein JZ751_005195 [Albula glossodonta]|uniref:Uncharacterized protein n=1 Tax=Albula glossodonta TaxID=121402 RepID=A0A8T2P522_9TELE|nr:hypothetical protein JZ751_005195 [Albula glossodonta]